MMNNTKAVCLALHKTGGTVHDIDGVFNTSLTKAGFISFEFVHGQLDWMMLVGSVALVDEAMLPVIKRAYMIRWST